MIFCMSVAEPDPGADAALEDCIVRIAGGDQNALMWVITKDEAYARKAAGVLAAGVPCRPIRPITEADRLLP